MILPKPSPDYDAENEAQARAALVREDARNVKINQNIDVRSAKLILTAPNGSRWSITITNAGVVTPVAL